jgi:hypothetical protein
VVAQRRARSEMGSPLTSSIVPQPRNMVESSSF